MCPCIGIGVQNTECIHYDNHDFLIFTNFGFVLIVLGGDKNFWSRRVYSIREEYGFSIRFNCTGGYHKYCQGST